MITSGVIVVAFNDAAAMTPIVTNKCEERGEGEKERGRGREQVAPPPSPIHLSKILIRQLFSPLYTVCRFSLLRFLAVL